MTVSSQSGTRATGDAELLPPALRDPFLARSRLMKIRRGQIIFAEGDEATDVYLVREGKVQVSLVSPQGREIILRELGAHQVFGETAAIDSLPRSANIISVEESLLARMRGEDFIGFLESVPGAALWMAQMFAARIRDLTERAFELATLPVAARVHGELLRLASESGSSDECVPIHQMPRHADLASRIGTHREAVTRELNLLAADGILRQSGRKAEILSVTRLRTLYERMRR